MFTIVFHYNGSSSCVTQAAYDEERLLFHLQFTSSENSFYEYKNVPHNVVYRMPFSTGAGEYFNKYILPKYDYRKLPIKYFAKI